MNGNEIKERIDALNALIEGQLTPSFFTLNKQIEEAQKAIEKLREICPHQFSEDGPCIFCGKEK